MNRVKSAGDFIETECTRCRKLMNHTIVAMIEEKVVRVECNTCHGIHNYHLPKGVKKPAASRTESGRAEGSRRAKKDPTASAAAEWAALQSGRDPAQAVPYSMEGRYRINTMLLHPRFGLGFVQLVAQNKIDVLFQEGKKRLLCG